MIAKSDIFILYDEMQYTRRDWRNRNRIKTKDGLIWLTVPVNSKGNYSAKISEIKINGTDWQKKHWRILENNYKKSPFYEEIKNLIYPLYSGKDFQSLSDLNEKFIQKICEYLGIRTLIMKSSDLEIRGNPSEKLLNICKQLKTKNYLSGPAAKDYLEVDLFRQEGISVEWMNYNDYPTYSQDFGEFVGEVTVLDLLFNVGPNSSKYMKFGCEG